MKNPNMFLVASVVLILMAVALIAILDRTKSDSSADVRARATSTQALAVTGDVLSLDELKGTLMVDNVQLSDTNRTGAPQNYGTWIVTAPPAFNFASVSPGARVVIGVDAATFLVSAHTLTAVTIIPAN